MKTFIFDSENQFSHKTILFSPLEFVDHLFLISQGSYSEIFIEKRNKSLVDGKLKIRDFESLSSTPILHQTSLSDLYEKHPWYFKEIKKKAEEENFIPFTTYVCELVLNYKDHYHFPRSINILKKEIKEGKIKADYYDKFGEIEAVENLFLNYFKLHLNEDSLVCFWNLFVNSKSSFGSKIKKVLIDFKKESLFDYEE